MPGQPSAAVLTIGNELVSGDVENTNAPWLATRLERLGIGVNLIAAVPDDVESIASFVRANAATVDVLIVTGGLGGTPDDVTREAIAAAYELPQAELPDVAADLRARFRSDPDYAARWALLPRGARPLENPLGGAPGFTIENVYVLPGLPAEMQAMFATIESQLHGDSPIASWRRRYRTTESRIVGVLEAMGELHPGVLVGSYPRFDALGSEVEIVVKSRDPAALASAAEWIEAALEEAMR
jgi:nicotinamide-nucleotide amidase